MRLSYNTLVRLQRRRFSGLSNKAIVRYTQETLREMNVLADRAHLEFR
jgi:hypothetical protein